MEKLLAGEVMDDLKISGKEDMEKSIRLRVNGNVLYKEGKLDEAIATYQAAAAAAPSSPLSLSNLSAAYYEKGDYESSVEYLEKAMSRSDDPSAVMKKVFARVVKSLLHIQKWESARDVLSKCDVDIEEAKTYEKIIDQAERVWAEWSRKGELDVSPQERVSEASDQDCKEAKRRLFHSLPRYKVAITNPKLEYYAVGHDDAKSLFDDRSQASIIPSKLFFAGIGDGRNLYATLISIAKHEMQSKQAHPFHISINDINAHALTRVVVILSLVEELAEVGQGPKRAMVLATLYYVLVGVAMPLKVFLNLKSTLDKIIKALQGSNRLFRIDLQSCCPEILRCLLSWRDFDMDALPLCPMLRHHLDSQMDGYSQDSMDHDSEDYEVWDVTGVLFPPPPFQSDEHELKELLREMKPQPTELQKKRLAKYLTDNWKPNPTIVDFDSIRELSLDWDPFSEVRSFYGDSGIKKPAKNSPLFNQISPFFEKLAEAWKYLQGNITVEGLVGDVVQIAENIHHSTLDRSEGYPKLFDKIHLSNIPDYIGGFLATGIFFSKIINPGRENWITATCLRNPGVWKSVSQYHDEYALIGNPENLDKLLQVQHLEKSSTFQSMMSLPPFLEYQFWWRLSSEPHVFSNLLPREDLKRWLFALFFKLCVPVNQSRKTLARFVLPTLNLSIYFRVLMHLHQLGYPAHWLAEVLVAIIENKVISTVRQFKTSPLETSELMKKHAPRKLSTAPYIPEMTTLTVLFQRILPFAIPVILPSPKTIYHFSIKIPIQQRGADTYPLSNAILVFYHSRHSSLVDGTDHNGSLDKLLGPLSNEGKTKKQQDPEGIAKFYEEGLIVISTWEWDAKSGVGRFWMADGEIERLGGELGEWKVGVWGTILWEKMHKRGVDVVGNLKKEEAWFA